MREPLVADAIVRAGAVDLSLEPVFRQRSGTVSPVYCNLRRVLAHPREREIVADALAERLVGLRGRYDTVAATATGAIPWGALASAHREVEAPFVYVTPESKTHGTGGRIHGDLPANHRVILLEDVVTRGGSAAEAVKVLRTEGAARVAEVLAIVDYGWPNELSALDSPPAFRALVTIPELVELAAERRRMTRGEIQRVLRLLDLARDAQ